MISLTFFGSGSDGNSALLEFSGLRFLLDAGLSLRRIEEGLRGNGLSLEDLNGIFITHEHDDHIKGLGKLVKKCRAPIFASPGTSRALRDRGYEGPEPVHLIPGKETSPDGLRVWPFAVPHDAAEPLGLRFEFRGAVLGIATDLGHVSSEILPFLTDCDLLCLESNYDEKMLAACPYPYWLKKRIAGPLGHLSNPGVRTVLSRLRKPLSHLVLVHLSRESNTPETALANILPMRLIPHLTGTLLTAAERQTATPRITFPTRSRRKSVSPAVRPIQGRFDFFAMEGA